MSNTGGLCCTGLAREIAFKIWLTKKFFEILSVEVAQKVEMADLCNKIVLYANLSSMNNFAKNLATILPLGSFGFKFRDSHHNNHLLIGALYVVSVESRQLCFNNSLSAVFQCATCSNHPQPSRPVGTTDLPEMEPCLLSGLSRSSADP